MYKVMCKSDVLLVYLQVSVVLLLLLLQLVLQVCVGLGSAFWLAFQLLLLRDWAVPVISSKANIDYRGWAIPWVSSGKDHRTGTALLPFFFISSLSLTKRPSPILLPQPKAHSDHIPLGCSDIQRNGLVFWEISSSTFVSERYMRIYTALISERRM